MVAQCSSSEGVGRHFCIGEPPPRVMTRALGAARLVVTRVSSEAAASRTTTPAPREDAFLIVLYLAPLPLPRLWLDHRELRLGYRQAGDICIIPLECEMVANIEAPFDMLQFYIPRSALDELADDIGVPRIRTLHCDPGTPVQDPVLSQLGLALLPMLEEAREPDLLFLQHMALALRVHLARTYGRMSTPSPATRVGELAPWRQRRAEDMLRAGIASGVSLDEVARECSMSVSQFGRTFKTTTGVSPHRWLVQRRVEQAKDLLLRSTLPLAEIALDCGFSEQSHFTRTFTRLVGTSPGEWRRRRRQ
jgi:AraC family transcriptional regulator